jgi:shikimate dehydrogenase
MIDSTRFGLIGDPIGHSASPQLFQTAYSGRYPYDLIEGSDFEASYVRFLREYKAINVTAPFKEAAYEKADIVSGPCALIGAANILVHTAEGVECHNSDFTGVILTIAEELFPGIISEFYKEFGASAHKRIHQFVRKCLEQKYGRRPAATVAGCGGAGKAAAVAAAEMGFETTILNRSLDKATAFSKGLPEYKFRVASTDDFVKECSKADLVIYTLPMALDSLDEFCRTQSEHNRILLEANYRNPAFTGLRLARLQDAEVSYIPGRRWLLCQAISGYGIMTGETPDIEALLEA